MAPSRRIDRGVLLDGLSSDESSKWRLAFQEECELIDSELSTPEARPSFASRVKTPYHWVVRRKGK